MKNNKIDRMGKKLKGIKDIIRRHMILLLTRKKESINLTENFLKVVWSMMWLQGNKPMADF